MDSSVPRKVPRHTFYSEVEDNSDAEELHGIPDDPQKRETMTEGSWDDYVDTSAIDMSDPSTAVPMISDEVHDLADDAALTDLVTPIEQVSLDTAAFETDLAEDQQDWADWNTAIGDQASQDAAAELSYASDQLAQGNVETAASAFEQAEMYADYSTDQYADASANATAVDGYLDDSVASLDNVDYSLDTSMDTSLDTSLDTSMDTSLDTAVDTSTDYSLDTSTDY